MIYKSNIGIFPDSHKKEKAPNIKWFGALFHIIRL